MCSTRSRTWPSVRIVGVSSETAAPRDEHLRRAIDPDLLDLGVVQVLLQRPQTRHVRENGARGVGPIGDGRYGPGERLLIPVGEHLVDELAHGRGVAHGIHSAPPDLLAYAGLHLGQRIAPHGPNVVAPGIPRNRNCG